MKQFFCDEKGQLSMGRLLTLILFVLCAVMWVVNFKDLSANNMVLIQWGFITAIGGKALSKGAENLGGKKQI